jgi:UDP-N-acetylglucosamine 1-carboxyvinyltransferase
MLGSTGTEPASSLGAISDVVRVRGGVPLEGTVAVRGAKNTVPKTMVAAMLTREPCEITNVAAIRDIEIVSGLLGSVGAEVTRDGPTVVVRAEAIDLPSSESLADYHAKSRIPVLTAAPLLHRTGEARIYHPGGCALGERPVDFHVDILRTFGATVEEDVDGYRIHAASLEGALIDLDYPSVGATEQFLLCAVLARGDSELRNAAIEPEIEDLACVLQKMGAILSILPNRVIRVSGVDELHGFHHRSMPDRLEAASWACAALATAGRIVVEDAQQSDMMTFLNCYRRAGGQFIVRDDGIEFFRNETSPLRPMTLETDVHPGFMTDWQAPFATALTQAHGVSVLHETVYEGRLGYVDALNSLGANIQVFQECLGPTPCRFGSRNFEHSAVVVGPTPLHAGTLIIPDLRGGFSYFIAALAAEGTSEIIGATVIDRGYERFREKLVALGARFTD